MLLRDILGTIPAVAVVVGKNQATRDDFIPEKFGRSPLGRGGVHIQHQKSDLLDWYGRKNIGDAALNHGNILVWPEAIADIAIYIACFLIHSLCRVGA